MNLEDIINKILEQRQDLKKEEVKKLIENKKVEAQGLLSDEGAARLVAQELLVKIEGRSFNEIKITDLVSNLSNVTLTARIIAQWPLQEFRKQDGTSGKLLKLVLADKTATIRCVLWNSKAEQIASSGALLGRIIRLVHAYTREGWLGATELNGGDRCEITVLPADLRNQDYPDISEFFKKLQEVKLSNGEVNVIGVVNSSPKISSFVKDGQEGRILRVTIADQGGTINIVSWSDRIQDVANLRKGDILQIVAGRVKADLSGNPEVHIGNNSAVSILQEKPPYLKMDLTKYSRISDLKPSKYLSLVVTVINVGEIREYTGTDGRTSRYGTVLVGDDTGLVRLFLWDDKTEVMNTLHRDDTLLIEGGQTKEKHGEVFVSVGRSGRLIRNSNQIHQESPHHPKQVMINQLKDFSRPTIIEGILAENADLHDIQTETGQRIKVATLIMTDGSGRARLSLWRELAEKVSNLKAGTKIRIFGIQPRSILANEVIMTSTSLTTIEINEDEVRSSDNGRLISHYI